MMLAAASSSSRRPLVQDPMKAISIFIRAEVRSGIQAMRSANRGRQMPQAASLAHAKDRLSWTSNQSRLFGRSFCPLFPTIGGSGTSRFLAP